MPNFIYKNQTDILLKAVDLLEDASTLPSNITDIDKVVRSAFLICNSYSDDESKSDILVVKPKSIFLKIENGILKTFFGKSGGDIVSHEDYFLNEIIRVDYFDSYKTVKDILVTENSLMTQADFDTIKRTIKNSDGTDEEDFITINDLNFKYVFCFDINLASRSRVSATAATGGSSFWL